MNTRIRLVAPFLATALQLIAGPLATSVVVSTDFSDCSYSSVGVGYASAACSSAQYGIPDAFASGTASASPGLLSIYAFVLDSGDGIGNANSTAQYDFSTNVLGAISGTMTGRYSIQAFTTNDFESEYAAWSISLGQGGSTLELPLPPYFRVLLGTVTLNSTFTAGEPLELAASVQGYAAGPGDENTMVTVRLLDLVDQAGNSFGPVGNSFGPVPEPTFWPVPLLTLLAIRIWKPSRRVDSRAGRN
jgi:hypothetical protein